MRSTTTQLDCGLSPDVVAVLEPTISIAMDVSANDPFHQDSGAEATVAALPCRSSNRPVRYLEIDSEIGWSDSKKTR